jgi:hypothetical protein
MVPPKRVEISGRFDGLASRGSGGGIEWSTVPGGLSSEYVSDSFTMVEVNDVSCEGRTATTAPSPLPQMTLGSE